MKSISWLQIGLQGFYQSNEQKQIISNLSIFKELFEPEWPNIVFLPLPLLQYMKHIGMLPPAAAWPGGSSWQDQWVQLLLSHLQIQPPATPKFLLPRHKQKKKKKKHNQGLPQRRKASQSTLMLPGQKHRQLQPLLLLGWQRQEFTHMTLSHPTGPQLTSWPSQWSLPTGIPQLQLPSNTCTDLPSTWHPFPNLGPPSCWRVQLGVFWQRCTNTFFASNTDIHCSCSQHQAQRLWSTVPLKPSVLNPLLVLVPLVAGFQDTHCSPTAAGRPPAPQFFTLWVLGTYTPVWPQELAPTALRPVYPVAGNLTHRMENETIQRVMRVFKLSRTAYGNLAEGYDTSSLSRPSLHKISSFIPSNTCPSFVSPQFPSPKNSL